MSAPPRTFPFGLIVFVALALCITVLGQSPAQPQADTQLGIQLYNDGDVQHAVTVLTQVTKKSPNDADAWHFLGLSYFKLLKYKEARTAFERSIKLRPDFAPVHVSLADLDLHENKLGDVRKEANAALALDAKNAKAHFLLAAVNMREEKPGQAWQEADATLRLDPKLNAALLVKCEALESLFESGGDNSKIPSLKPRYRYLKEAAKLLETYFQLNPDEPIRSRWRGELDLLRPYEGLPDSLDGTLTDQIFDPETVTTKARVLRKPFPQYTEEARQRGVSGTVVLKLVFSADGMVQTITPIHSLGSGLTEEAIRVARLIRFLPATKDGRPVSTYVKVEYSFDIY